jgi:predicted Zn-dependent peptidase
LPQPIYHHTFPNGLTLLAERMEHVRSATLNVLVPAGCIYDPPHRLGIGSVMTELIVRGAGSRDSRELTLALDNLGVDRDESVASVHVRFWGGTVARNLPAALEIYADILRRPHFPDDEMEPVRALALQDLQSLEDEPRHKIMIELRRHHFPSPLGQDRRGTIACVEKLTIADVREHHRRMFRPNGTILSVAGNIDWPQLRDQVERLFGDWPRGDDPPLQLGPQPGRQEHISKETEQTQIGIAYDSVPVGHPDYYAALAAVHVLGSGGSSSRLFTEVREKRGLCYAVSANYHMLKDRASIFCYAGTTTPRAQETLDVTLREVGRLAEGIEEEELVRVQAGIKSALIMQQEWTSARANMLASDWYYLGRVRSIEEIQGAVNALTPQKIVDHLHQYPAKDFTIVTLGAQPLKLPA